MKDRSSTRTAELRSRFAFPVSAIVFVAGAIGLWHADSTLATISAMLVMSASAWIIGRIALNDRSFDWGSSDILLDNPTQAMRRKDIAAWKVRWRQNRSQ